MGRLAAAETPYAPTISHGSLWMYDKINHAYATLYRNQPNVRTCVDFLARNVAQLGLHVFRRQGETDRVRLRDHGLTRVLNEPLPPECKVTRYRLIESLMADLGVYFNAFWFKIRADGQPLRLLRVPPELVSATGALVATQYEINLGSKVLAVGPGELVHFRGYNAESQIWGLSPLETLRRVLAEEEAAGDYRQGFWGNAARMGGVVQRPADAPQWSEQARERFKAEFEQLYSGADNSGRTAVLEEGMEWKQVSFNAEESQYLEGRKLTREECARAYHIPLPMVGILDHATFSNIREQHKNLYQDCLGPWMAMIEQDIELQLLPEFEDRDGVYTEFNIAEKLQGSFEEQVQALQGSVGRPWMTANEARARMNLPSMGGDADELITPLNVLSGGQASPQDSAPDKAATAETKAARTIDASHLSLRERHEKRWTATMARTFRRQEAAVVSRMPKKAAVLLMSDLWADEKRWNEELGVDLLALNLETAKAWGQRVAGDAGTEWDPALMMEWLSENARIAAEEINGATRDAVAQAITEEDPLAGVKAVFVLALTVRAAEIARSKVTQASSFGAQEAAKQGGLKSKTWHVNSTNPRDEHAALDGVTVGIRELFPNGMKWPGDPQGGVDQVANCQCSVSFSK
jgi:HK97 family phage portal protein